MATGRQAGPSEPIISATSPERTLPGPTSIITSHWRLILIHEVDEFDLSDHLSGEVLPEVGAGLNRVAGHAREQTDHQRARTLWPGRVGLEPIGRRGHTGRVECVGDVETAGGYPPFCRKLDRFQNGRLSAGNHRLARAVEIGNGHVIAKATDKTSASAPEQTRLAIAPAQSAVTAMARPRAAAKAMSAPHHRGQPGERLSARQGYALPRPPG